MKKTYDVFRSLFVLILFLPLVASAQIWTEDFDGSNITNPPTWSEQCSDDKDYFDIVCQDGGGCANEVNSAFVLNGATGNYFGVRDSDASPCSSTFPKTLGFSGINVSSCTSVSYLCFDVAESRNMGGASGDEWSSSNNREDTWDSNATVFIKASVDGAGYTNVTAIEAFTNSDTRPGIDVNCDGRADDAGEPALTDTFTKYCFELPTSGASLDLEIEVSALNTQGEDLAIDNIEVHCGTPSSGTVLAACTPFVPGTPVTPTTPGVSLFLEDFDGSNTTNPAASSDFCGDNNDYFGVVCQNGGGCANDILADFVFNNVSGSYFGVRDMDASPCSGSDTKTLSFSGIDVSSCTDVSYVCFDVAESRNMGGSAGSEWGTSNMREDTWDSNSNVFVKASLDGSTFTTVTAIEAFENSDTRPGIDVNCSGKAKEAGEPELTDTFTRYCFELPTSGSSLDLEFEVNNLNTQGEDFAMDNIEVFCGSPTSGTVLSACTPFISQSTLFFENFDGSNTANPFTFPNCDASPSRDYLGVVCLDGEGCTNEINDDYLYSNASGQFFGVRDMDNVCSGSLDETITATGINVTSCGDGKTLYMCVDIAESSPNVGRELNSSDGTEDTWDGNQSPASDDSFVTFSVRMNGGSYYPVAGLTAFGNNNSGPGIDTNCDGTADGAPLTDAFQTFCFEIASKGNVMDLAVRVGGMNTDGDDVAIDNISVICTDDVAELPAALSTSCTTLADITPIPTMGEWGIFLFALLILTLGTVTASLQQMASASDAPVSFSIKHLPFDKGVYNYWLVRVALFLVGIFTLAVVLFGYEMTNADVPGILLTIPLAAYFLHFVMGEKK